MTDKLYANRDHRALGDHYINHVSAMTGEGLHRKSDIAAELAWRDAEIERLRAALAQQAQPLERQMLDALRGVVRVADRATVEFDAARAAIAAAEAGNGSAAA